MCERLRIYVASLKRFDTIFMQVTVLMQVILKILKTRKKTFIRFIYELQVKL